MMTPVNKVLVSCKYVQANLLTTLEPLGTIGILGMNNEIASALEPGDTFRIAQVIDQQDIAMPDGTLVTKNILRYSNPISEQYIKNQEGLIDFLTNLQAAGTNYQAPVQDVITVDLSSVVITSGTRYVLRLQFRDFYELVAPYSRSYEYIADGTTTLGVLTTQLAAEVNRDPYSNASATVAGNVITLTGLAKQDNNGVYSLNEFTMTELFATLYFTTPRDSILFNNYYQDAGAVVTKTNGTMGSGYWKVVRDRENRALGYKGFTNRTMFPVIFPKLFVQENINYDTVVVEQERMFLSNDNQYRKNTPVTDEIYLDVASGSTVTLVSDLLSLLGLPISEDNE